MKPRRVRWSRAVLDDLIEISRDIAEDNPFAATRVASAIRATGARLGQAAIGRRGRVGGTYELVVRRLPYILAYRIAPSDNGEAIVILHIIHGARDWPDGDWPK